MRKGRIKRIVVFIDEHEIPWYGKPNPYVVGTNSFNGTKSCFKYITINTVIDNCRICLFALPVTPFSRKDRLVDELLCIANELKYLAPMEKKEKMKWKNYHVFCIMLICVYSKHLFHIACIIGENI